MRIDFATMLLSAMAPVRDQDDQMAFDAAIADACNAPRPPVKFDMSAAVSECESPFLVEIDDDLMEALCAADETAGRNLGTGTDAEYAKIAEDFHLAAYERDVREQALEYA